MTQTSTQRYMNEHIGKGARMQTKQRKPNKMAQRKQNGHKGSKACYHTKGKGKHVVRQIESLTRETLTCKASKGEKGKRQANQHHKDLLSQIWLHSNKPPKGYACNQTSKWPKDIQATNPQRENKQETWQGCKK